MILKEEILHGKFVMPHETVLKVVDAVGPVLGVKTVEVEKMLKQDSDYGRLFNLESCEAALNNLLDIYRNCDYLEKSMDDFFETMWPGVETAVYSAMRKELCVHLAVYTAMAVCTVAVVEGQRYIEELKKIKFNSVVAAASANTLIALIERLEKNKTMIPLNSIR